MVNPQGMDLLFWADTLFIDFPDDDIPILTDASLWKSWGNDLIQCESFAASGAPDTNDYDDWFSWAQQLYYSMSDYA